MGRVPIPKPSFLDGCEYLGYILGERRWLSPDGRILTWDGLHGEIESYDRRGRHIAVLNALTGDPIKRPRRGRRIGV